MTIIIEHNTYTIKHTNTNNTNNTNNKTNTCKHINTNNNTHMYYNNNNDNDNDNHHHHHDNTPLVHGDVAQQPVSPLRIRRSTRNPVEPVEGSTSCKGNGGHRIETRVSQAPEMLRSQSAEWARVPQLASARKSMHKNHAESADSHCWHLYTSPCTCKT